MNYPDRTKTTMCDADIETSEQLNKNDPMQMLIGQQLKAYYNGVLSEPIPERLLHLLDKLDQVTTDDGDKGS